MRDMFRIAHAIRMSAKDTAEVMLYGEIVQDMPKFWKEQLPNDKSASDFNNDIKDVIDKGAKKLLLRINSPGGVCTESIAMRTILAQAGFEEITIRIEGLCASAATNIATLPGAHVQIAEGSEYMIHNPWTIGMGNADDMEHTAERLRNIEKMSRDFYAQKCGQSEEQIKAWMDAETWFTAEQAVENGFCDELLKAESTNEMPMAACVSGRCMDAMRQMYHAVPENIAVWDDEPEEQTEPAENDSNRSPVAGDLTVNTNEEENDTMDIRDLTRETLLAENPALVEEITQQAVAAERQRIQDIDDLTMPGYETMAADAKANGTSAMDYHKQIVQAQKKKGAAYLTARQEETEPAQNVAGGASSDNDQTEEDEILANAKLMAMEAEKLTSTSESMF